MGTRRPSRRTTTRIDIEVDAERGVFMISVAAELAEMHPQTLRMYEQRGLIEPTRSAKGTRLYSHRDVERLRRIQQMTGEMGLNLAGVERVLELEDELERARDRYEAATRRVEEVERRTIEMRDRMRAEMAAEIERLRSRTDIVPYTGCTDVVHVVRRRGRR